jgi:uncharacterized protein (TIGR04222 family)
MTSPFSLAGPQFLLFYAVLAVVALSVYGYFLSTLGDAEAVPKLTQLTADPYRIAILRADRDEAVRVAVVNLVDRGLLACSGTALSIGKNASADFVRRALDRAILQACASRTSFGALLGDARVAAACADYEHELEADGLLYDASQRRTRVLALVAILLLLGGFGVARLLQALSRGQANVGFLIALGALVCWIAVRLARGHAAPAGRKALRSLETLTARVKNQVHRLRAGGATNEALLLAAVYGVYALPSSVFGFMENLFPKPRKSDTGSCGSSSCGSSGGGSCGGGGGGCGGCGGG